MTTGLWIAVAILAVAAAALAWSRIQYHKIPRKYR